METLKIVKDGPGPYGETVAQLVEQSLQRGALTLSAVIGEVLSYVEDEDVTKAIREVTDLVTPLARPGQYSRKWVWVPGTAMEIEELHLLAK